MKIYSLALNVLNIVKIKLQVANLIAIMLRNLNNAHRHLLREPNLNLTRVSQPSPDPVTIGLGKNKV